LQHRSPVAWAVIGDENKRLQRRHFTRVKRTPKFRGFLFLFRAVNFSAVDPFVQLLLERSQNLVAASDVLPVLLIVVQPKRRVDADKTSTSSAVQRATRERSERFGFLRPRVTTPVWRRPVLAYPLRNRMTFLN
jgi:hypothetical protein